MTKPEQKQNLKKRKALLVKLRTLGYPYPKMATIAHELEPELFPVVVKKQRIHSILTGYISPANKN